MSSPYLGELRLISWNYPPKGWAFCNGQLLPINQNQALFSLLGTMYGGDGRQTFALPNLQGRVIVHFNQGFAQGATGGEQAVNLNIQTLPSHGHKWSVASALGVSPAPAGNRVAVAPMALGNIFGSTAPAGTMPPSTIQAIGGDVPHENMMPYLVMNYIIALQGVFPSRN